MGLLVEPSAFVASPVAGVGLVVGILGVKALIAGGTIALLGYGVRTSFIVGLGLAQIGEFSFILAKEGLHEGLMTEPQYGLFMGASVATMVFAPLLLNGAPKLADWLGLEAPDDSAMLPPEGTEATDQPEMGESKRDHVVIVGFGWNGRAVARAFRDLDVPYVVTELNPETIREWHGEEPIYYGDATEPAILEALGIGRARALVVTVAERWVARRVVEAGREARRNVPILVRTRYASDVEALYESRASQVVAEEFESSLELTGAALECYDIPLDQVREEKQRLRTEIRHLASPSDEEGPTTPGGLDALAAETVVEMIEGSEDAPAEGTTPEEWMAHHEGRAELVAVVRDGDVVPVEQVEVSLEAGDRLVVVGPAEELAEIERTGS